jgi:hypothetical protein
MTARPDDIADRPDSHQEGTIVDSAEWGQG